MTKEQFRQIADDAFEVYQMLPPDRKKGVDSNVARVAATLAENPDRALLEAPGAQMVLYNALSSIAAIIPARAYLEMKEGHYMANIVIAIAAPPVPR